MKRILIFLNYAFAILLLSSYLAPYINPAVFWPIALLGLAYPFLLIFNVLFLFYWIVRRKKYLWVSLLTILFGWSYIFRFVQLGIDQDGGDATGPWVEVLSYNVRVFDLYNWKDENNEQTRDKIYEFIGSDGADILCLQEYYSNDNGDFSSAGAISEAGGAINVHESYTTSLGPNHWGIATFSRFPIVGKGQVKFESSTSNICVFTDIATGEDTVRVYNAHLGSVHFGYEEYELLEKVGTQAGSRDSSGPLGKSRQIEKAQREDIPVSEVTTSMVRLLKRAFVNRAAQARAVANHAAESPYPVIICGDINDTPMSYAYELLAKDRQDAFKVAGVGFGNTYAGVLPFFRIDYILCDQEIGLVNFSTNSNIPYSDHYPVSCNLVL
ncbi:MAG: endonuclease/exonuclease/phosphatase family protein [Flavobacteriales bacterium]|nr:endonuclease/exonuclease/phosphatase family protein [Flavobacteriales bacterium]